MALSTRSREFAGAVYGKGSGRSSRARFADSVYGSEDGSEYRSPEEHFETFTDKCRRLIRDKFDNVIVIDGHPRLGKSALGLQIATRIDRDFSLEHCAYSADDVMALYPRCSVGDVILYDEGALGLMSQGGHRDPELRAMVQMLSIVGIKRVTMIVCLPTIHLLDAFVKHGRARYWLNVYTRGLAKVHRAYQRARYRTSTSLLPYDTWSEVSPLGWKNLDRTHLWAEYEAQKVRRVEEWLEAHRLDPEGKVAKCPRCGKVDYKRRLLTHSCPGEGAPSTAEPQPEREGSDGNVPERSITGGGGVGGRTAPRSDELRCRGCGRSFDNDHNWKTHESRCKKLNEEPSLLSG